MPEKKIKISVEFDTSSIPASVQKIKDAVSEVRSSARSMTSSGRVGGGRAPKAPPYIVDPDGYIAENQAAALAGDPTAASKVLRAVRQKRMVARAQDSLRPPSPLEAFSRTRWTNVGGKLVGSPLGRDLGAIGDLMGSAGMGEAGSVVSGVVGAASGASPVAAAVIALTGATVALNKTMSGLARGGGGTGNAWGAMVAAGAIGSSGPGNFSGTATGIKAALMASMGENPIRGYFGAMDHNETYLRIARKVSRMPYAQARRTASGLEDPEMANYALMDDWISKAVLRNRDDSPWMARFGANAQGLGSIAADVAKAFGTTGPWSAIKFGFDGLTRGNGQSDAEKAQREQTQATKDLTNVMRDGIYGGGARARSAIPRDRQHWPNGVGGANKFGMGFL